MRLDDELPTRLVPYSRAEFSHARNRPPEERPPWPKVGDELYYRRNSWDGDDALFRMRVIEVQSPDDTTSEWAHNVNQTLRHNLSGEVMVGPSGRPLTVPVPDPWPWVKLVYDGEIPKGSDYDWMHRPQQTCESRVRGSAGWLPLDYRQTRKVQLPDQLVAQPVPTPPSTPLPSLPAPAPRPER